MRSTIDRFTDARNQPIGQAIEVEVAVELARKRDQRAAIVVAVAIERAVDRVLHPSFTGLRQQNHDHRGQERDEPAMFVFALSEEAARRAEDQHVNRGDGGHRRRCRPAGA